MIASQYLIKFIYSLLDTPFFYLLTRKSEDKSKYENGYNQNLNEIREKYNKKQMSDT